MNTKISTHTVIGEPMEINIRLDDPCKNGHNDFSITATIWRKGALRLIDNNIARCGCCHEDILNKMPSLKLFVDLHLSDESGAPMCALANGFYHLQGVQGTAAYGHTMTLKGFANYMRVSETEAAIVAKTIKDKETFSIWLDALRPRWKAEADQAKALLSELIEKTQIKAN